MLVHGLALDPLAGPDAPHGGMPLRLDIAAVQLGECLGLRQPEPLRNLALDRSGAPLSAIDTRHGGDAYPERMADVRQRDLTLA